MIQYILVALVGDRCENFVFFFFFWFLFNFLFVPNDFPIHFLQITNIHPFLPFLPVYFVFFKFCLGSCLCRVLFCYCHGSRDGRFLFSFPSSIKQHRTMHDKKKKKWEKFGKLGNLYIQPLLHFFFFIFYFEKCCWNSIYLFFDFLILMYSITKKFALIWNFHSRLSE